MLHLTRPRYFLPAHGEARHQVLHRRLAAEEGVKVENVFLLDNGMRWNYDGHSAGVLGFVPSGEVLVDGMAQGDTGESDVGEAVADHRVLSQDQE